MEARLAIIGAILVLSTSGCGGAKLDDATKACKSWYSIGETSDRAKSVSAVNSAIQFANDAMNADPKYTPLADAIRTAGQGLKYGDTQTYIATANDVFDNCDEFTNLDEKDNAEIRRQLENRGN